MAENNNNQTLNMTVAGYENCTMKFNNATGAVELNSTECMELQDKRLLQKCYVDNLPFNDHLCIVMYGTNTKEYFTCLNTFFGVPPKYADGCWIS